jgi:hypothetical protein
LADLRRAQFRSTGPARHAGAAIDLVLILERTPATISGPVITDGAASKLDRMGKHATNRPKEPLQPVTRHAIGPTLRMKSCPKQDLVHIDVAEARDSTLIKKR